jgi:NADPH-dependent curcumin reductase CurA
MNPSIQKAYILKNRPNPDIDSSTLSLEEIEVRKPKQGEMLVQNLFLSIDPTNRIWMDEKPSYLPPIPLGTVMRGLVGGRVVESRIEGINVGDMVVGMGGWSQFGLATEKEFRPIPSGVALEAALSVFGHIGLTAYFGLLDVGRLNSGETVLVSGAAGATGSLVGQIAKIKGCRVIGTAGSDEKVQWIKSELGFDDAFNYKKEKDFVGKLRKLAPNGIDVYFDNVGGEMLDAALANLAMRGRVVLCGAISQYNVKDVVGPRNYLNLLMQRGRMEGFIVLDYMGRASEAIADLSKWTAQGKIKTKVDIVDGFENALLALKKLFDGNHNGKLLVRIST